MNENEIINLQDELGELSSTINGIDFASTIRHYFWTFAISPEQTADYYWKGFAKALKSLAPILYHEEWINSQENTIFVPSLNNRISPFLQGFKKFNVITRKDLVKPGESHLKLLNVRIYIDSIKIVRNVSAILAKKSIPFKLSHKMRLFFYLIEKARFCEKLFHIFKKQKFQAVMLHADNHPNLNYYVEVAKKLLIPTFLIQHGYDCEYKILDYLYADFVFVWGDERRERYLEKGIDPERIKVVGHPCFSGKPIHEINGLQAIRTILYCSRPHGWMKNYFNSRTQTEGLRVLESIICSTGSEIEILVKLHPAEDKELYQRLCSSFDRTVTFISEDIRDYADKFQLIIAEDSSISVEACFLGKQVIIAHFTSQKLMVPFDDFGYEGVAYNENELQEKLRRALYKENDLQKISETYKKITEHVYASSCVPVEHLIEELVEKRNQELP